MSYGRVVRWGGGGLYEGFPYCSDLRTHLVLTCEICNKRMTDVRKLKKHMRNHDQAQEEVCPYCGKVYKHMSAHFYSGEKIWCKVARNRVVKISKGFMVVVLLFLPAT